MNRSKKMRTFIILILWEFIMFFNPLPGLGETKPVDQLYLEAQFPRIIQYFEKKDYRALSLEEKLVFIESLARISRGLEAKDKLEPLLSAHSSEAEVLATAGAVYLSLGDLDSAKTHIDQALAIKPGYEKAIISRIFLLLYHREFNKAKVLYEKLLSKDKEWWESEFVYLVGIDVFRACGEPQKLNELYRTRAKKIKKTNKSQYESMKANWRMYRSAGQNILFQVSAGVDEVVVPFAVGGNTLRLNTISLTLKGKTFKVLLDTGNATGWLVHSRELNEILKPKTGGRTIARIGTEAGMLDGYRQYYKTIDFNTFKINHVNGIYVPKPHRDFPDANLNPSFIKDRVSTIDFIKRELVLRTREKFERYLSTCPKESFSRLPWYGYKFPAVPIVLKGKQGLAMIETGAEDVALKLDFVQGMQLQLIPRVKYLANGQVFKYHHAAVIFSVGQFLIRRQAAEVWPLDRFYNRITGISPDVVIGPRAFAGQFSITFNPFERQILLVLHQPMFPSLGDGAWE